MVNNLSPRLYSKYLFIFCELPKVKCGQDYKLSGNNPLCQQQINLRIFLRI